MIGYVKAGVSLLQDTPLISGEGPRRRKPNKE